jgi:6-phosphogluconolactonase
MRPCDHQQSEKTRATDLFHFVDDGPPVNRPWSAHALQYGAVPSNECSVYIGTYGGGIYSATLCGDTGKLTAAGLAAQTVNPSFLAIDRSGRFLYAVSEQPEGSVSAWARDAQTGALRFLNRMPSGGALPCHVAVDPSGRTAIVANYSGGLAGFALLEDGRLGSLVSNDRWMGASGYSARQSRPHPHGAFLSPDRRFAVVPDLGCDQLRVYRMGPDIGELSLSGLVATAAGAGPRHFAFHPSGGFGYALCELESTLVWYRYRQEDGVLSQCGTISTLPLGYCGETIAAEIALDRAGHYLYCSNRGADTIAVFGIDDDGVPHPVQQPPALGKNPRHFALDVSGDWMLVANQDSNQVAVFRRNGQTGEIVPAGQPIEVPSPACVAVAPLPPIQATVTSIHRS